MITCFLAFFICTSTAYGNLYYVSENAAGKGDGTSYENRMSVASHNARSFNPGDTIYLCGTISNTPINAPSSGVKGKPITYKSYDSDPALLRDYSLSRGIIGFRGLHWIVIDGLEIRNARIGISIVEGSSNIWVRRCHIQDVESAGIQVADSTYITIGGAAEYGNRVYYAGYGTGACDYCFLRSDEVVFSYNKGIGDPSPFGRGSDGATVQRCNNVLIEYNLFADHRANYPTGEDGIDLKGSTNIIVRNNIVYGNRMGGYKVNQSNPKVSCDTIVIYHNLAFDNGYNISASGGDEEEDHSNVFIWGNVFHSTNTGRNAGLHSQGDNFHFYNNTLYNPLSGEANIMLSRSTNFHVKNNIFYNINSHRQLWVRVSPENVDSDYNLYWNPSRTSQNYWDGSWVPSTRIETNSVAVNPLFKDATNTDFTLSEGSPAIGAGTPIKATPPDITVMGTTYSFDYGEILCPSTDWSTFPPKINTINQRTLKGGWVMGAYGPYGNKPLSPPKIESIKMSDN